MLYRENLGSVVKWQLGNASRRGQGLKKSCMPAAQLAPLPSGWLSASFEAAAGAVSAGAGSGAEAVHAIQVFMGSTLHRRAGLLARAQGLQAALEPSGPCPVL